MIVNLQFLQSLDNDRDWELFALAKSDSIHSLSMTKLLAEVHALNARRTGTGTGISTTTQTQSATPFTLSQSDTACVLSAHFDNDNDNDYRNDLNGYSRENNCGFDGHDRFG